MTRTALGVALAAALAVRLGAQAPHQWTLQPGSRIVASGTSNVKDFACRADTMHLQMATPDSGGAHAILNGSITTLTATLTVPATRLDCNNGTMNSHMRDALKAKDHPDIVFQLDSFALAKDTGGVIATAHGTLSMGGKTRAIVVAVHLFDGGDGVIHTTGTYSLNMSDYGLKPPTLFFGVLKVHDPVRIAFDMQLNSN